MFEGRTRRRTSPHRPAPPTPPPALRAPAPIGRSVQLTRSRSRKSICPSASSTCPQHPPNRILKSHRCEQKAPCAQGALVGGRGALRASVRPTKAPCPRSLHRLTFDRLIPTYVNPRAHPEAPSSERHPSQSHQSYCAYAFGSSKGSGRSKAPVPAPCCGAAEGAPAIRPAARWLAIAASEEKFTITRNGFTIARDGQCARATAARWPTVRLHTRVAQKLATRIPVGLLYGVRHHHIAAAIASAQSRPPTGHHHHHRQDQQHQ